MTPMRPPAPTLTRTGPPDAVFVVGDRAFIDPDAAEDYAAEEGGFVSTLALVPDDAHNQWFIQVTYDVRTTFNEGDAVRTVAVTAPVLTHDIAATLPWAKIEVLHQSDDTAFYRLTTADLDAIDYFRGELHRRVFIDTTYTERPSDDPPAP